MESTLRTKLRSKLRDKKEARTSHVKAKVSDPQTIAMQLGIDPNIVKFLKSPKQKLDEVDEEAPPPPP